ncbi:uncharacterized protein DEA37_0005156 [Paragonimus westermani]|uniref:Uncharacterized protein n=1 Tax=Paragonimus westermani TaxID=34504 RepID=A0A5J4NGS1_9TREM|nr:uncharacterized protein DEA37_0005156 [Paragonimus westermani]
MPRVRRKRTPDAGANVVGGRDVQKLQRLLRQNVDEEQTPSKRFKTQDTDSSDSESLKRDNELTTNHETSLELPHSDVADEYKAEWENFFGHSEADKEYISLLQKNLTEAKLKASEKSMELLEARRNIPPGSSCSISRGGICRKLGRSLKADRKAWLMERETPANSKLIRESGPRRLSVSEAVNEANGTLIQNKSRRLGRWAEH